MWKFIIRWAGHVARMDYTYDAYKILIKEPDGKGPIERPRCRWEYDIRWL
jgi:hypothetical protein